MRVSISPSTSSPLPVVMASVVAMTLTAVARLLTLTTRGGRWKESRLISSEKSMATPWSCSKER